MKAEERQVQCSESEPNASQRRSSADLVLSLPLTGSPDVGLGVARSSGECRGCDPEPGAGAHGAHWQFWHWAEWLTCGRLQPPIFHWQRTRLPSRPFLPTSSRAHVMVSAAP